MKLRLIICLAFCVLAPTLFSACTNVESKEQEEVKFDSPKTSSGEVFISDSDFKTEGEQISIVQPGGQMLKRTLDDKSEIETILDAFGNKIETRNFPENPQLQSVMVRTAADGKVQVTVYGYGSETKIVPELDAGVLTASADEIAAAAKLTVRRGSSSGSHNFMKNGKSAPKLQPLPSSAFPQPVAPVNQTQETVQPAASSETSTPAAKPEEEKD